ncbi:hypothetical protein, partial [Desulfamplus magnetovallimortis]|uniref:hypothetical protein n=1 Tax=Desulfamplus magnetovallimortis TaxID=1246637 RepID=UPI001C985ED9
MVNLKVFHREQKTFFCERRPFAANLISVLLYKWRILGVRNRIIHTIYDYTNERIKQKMDTPFSTDPAKRVQEVKLFADKLNVNLSQPYIYIKQLHEFENANDFFIRDIKREFRPVANAMVRT